MGKPPYSTNPDASDTKLVASADTLWFDQGDTDDEGLKVHTVPVSYEPDGEITQTHLQRTPADEELARLGYGRVRAWQANIHGWVAQVAKIVKCLNPDHDHTTEVDLDGMTLDEPCPMLCNDCHEPAHYDRGIEDYQHDDPDMECFLIHGPRRDGASPCQF